MIRIISNAKNYSVYQSLCINDLDDDCIDLRNISGTLNSWDLSTLGIFKIGNVGGNNVEFNIRTIDIVGAIG